MAENQWVCLGLFPPMFILYIFSILCSIILNIDRHLQGYVLSPSGCPNVLPLGSKTHMVRSSLDIFHHCINRKCIFKWSVFQMLWKFTWVKSLFKDQSKHRLFHPCKVFFRTKCLMEGFPSNSANVTFSGWWKRDPVQGLLVTSNDRGWKGHELNHLVVYFYHGILVGRFSGPRIEAWWWLASWVLIGGTTQ